MKRRELLKVRLLAAAAGDVPLRQFAMKKATIDRPWTIDSYEEGEAEKTEAQLWWAFDGNCNTQSERLPND